jgi:hypothetical protein
MTVALFFLQNSGYSAGSRARSAPATIQSCRHAATSRAQEAHVAHRCLSRDGPTSNAAGLAAIFSTPPSMSVKLVRLKEVPHRLQWRLNLNFAFERGSNAKHLKTMLSGFSDCQLTPTVLTRLRRRQPPVSSYQQRVHQRCLASRAPRG